MMAGAHSPNIPVYDLVVCGYSCNFTLASGKYKLSGQGAVSLLSAQCWCVLPLPAVNGCTTRAILDLIEMSASVDLVVQSPFAADKETGASGV